MEKTTFEVVSSGDVELDTMMLIRNAMLLLDAEQRTRVASWYKAIYLTEEP